MRSIRSLIPSRRTVSARTFVAACLAPLALAACGEEAGGFNLRLVRSACLVQDTDGRLKPYDTGIDYFPQAGTVQVVVTADDMAPIEASKSVTAKGLDISDIPAGKGRMATVKVWHNGTIASVGRSEPFDVVEGETADVQVFMRWTNHMARAADRNNHCVAMEEARIGHTAVKMRDGRVLLVGGHKGITGPSGTGAEFLASAEIFDPSSGTFYKAADPCNGDTCYQAARGQGVALPDGRVLIVGGEAPQAVDTAAIYDPVNDRWTLSKMTVARRGHSASLLGQRVIIIGGVDAEGNVLDSVEFFDPRNGTFTPDATVAVKTPGKVGRAFHTAVSRDTNTLLIAGGIAVGTKGEKTVVDEVLVYLSDKDKVSLRQRPDDKLFVPVAKAAGTMIEGRLVIVGGARQLEGGEVPSNLSQSVQWLELGVKGTEPTHTTTEENLRKADACVVAIDKGRALVLGGLNQMGAGLEQGRTLAWSEATSKIDVDILTTPARDRELPAGQVTCTNLDDGRILVTGGVTGRDATNRADIYTIQPLK